MYDSGRCSKTDANKCHTRRARLYKKAVILTAMLFAVARFLPQIKLAAVRPPLSVCGAAAAAANSCQFLQLECSKSADPIIGRRTCVNKQQSRHPERYSQTQHNRDEAEKGGSRSIRKWDWALLEPFIEQKRRWRCFNMTKSLMRVCMSERASGNNKNETNAPNQFRAGF